MAEFSEPPLVAAIRRGDTRKALQRIQLCVAADDLQQLEEADGNGAGPLTVACEKGHTEICRALLDAGAAVGARAYGGFTPLLVACETGHAEAVRLLLAEVTRTVTPRHYEEKCDDPVRSLLLLRAWTIWRARQGSFANAQRGRARHFAEQEALLERDVRALGSRCGLVGNRKANTLLQGWVPEMVARLRPQAR